MKRVDVKTHRTIFLSDFHLGSPGCQAEQILSFLDHNSAKTIYLIGDIVDGWRLKKSWYWPQAHNNVVQKLLKLSQKGTKIYYLSGNHDEFLRHFDEQNFGEIFIRERVVHQAANGKKYLVIHGDQFDLIVMNAKWLAVLGGWAYDFAMFLNVYYNRVRKLIGLDYYSISAWLKYRVKNAVSFIGKYEKALADSAKSEGYAGVICGHIHHAEIAKKGGVEYINTGDWVESCTAVTEDFAGQFELHRWAPIHSEIMRDLSRPKSKTKYVPIPNLADLQAINADKNDQQHHVN